MQTGTYHLLTVLSRQKAGYRLGDPAGDTAWLAADEAEKALRPGEQVEVFVYQNREEQVVATTRRPPISLHHFGYLRVKTVSQYGAFLDWGLDKDLFVPFQEQPEPMREGLSYLVYLYEDSRSGRLTASGYLHRFLQAEPLTVAPGEAVDLLIWEPTDLGVNVIVNHRHKGLIYANEIFVRLRPGEERQGYVKAIRPDNKLDIQLQAPGYQAVDDAREQLFAALQDAGGYLPLTDKAPPAEITRRLEMSKKVFKKALGALYRARRVRIEPDGIYLTEAETGG